MDLYLKVISFAKPWWKHIILSFTLTLFFILFNSVSLWVSVDFIQQLFNPEVISGQVDITDSSKPNQVTKLIGTSSIYDDISQGMKSIIVQANRFDTLKMVCLIIFLSYLLKNIADYYRKILLSYIELKIITLMRDKLAATFVRLPISYYERNNSGELTSIVFNDVNAVNSMINNSFGRMLLAPFQILVNIVIMFLIDWQLATITLTVIPLSAFSIWKIGQSIRRRSRRVFAQIGLVFNYFQEMLMAMRVVKAFTNERHEENRGREANKGYFKANFRATRLSHLTSPLNEIIIVMVLVFLLWYGGSQVYTGEGLKAEDFIRFLVFLITIFQPLKELTNVNNVIQNGMAAAERIVKTLDAPPEVYESPTSVALTTFSSNIEFKNVTFRYNPEDPIVLHSVSLKINRGETVAFVGHSGAGKTTIVDLVPRFYEINDGSISIDGIDIRTLKLESLRKQIGIVAQESVLFNETVRYNIGYGLESVTDEQIIEAAKNANAWEFIEKMEHGLDTVTGERGVKLSGGQKQRLSIARAILKNPPILILDEATSALDTESEKLVQDAIYKLMKNRTVLAIAHRLSTIQHADKIVVLSSGNIVAIGRHEELLISSPDYLRLYQLQFRNENKTEQNPS